MAYDDEDYEEPDVEADVADDVVQPDTEGAPAPAAPPPDDDWETYREPQAAAAPPPEPATEPARYAAGPAATMSDAAPGPARTPAVKPDDDWETYRAPVKAATKDDDWETYREPAPSFGGGLKASVKGYFEPLIKGVGEAIEQSSIVGPNPYVEPPPVEQPPEKQAAFNPFKIDRGGPFAGERAAQARKLESNRAAAQAEIDEARKVPFEQRTGAKIGAAIKGVAPEVTEQERKNYPIPVGIANVLGGGTVPVVTGIAGGLAGGPPGAVIGAVGAGLYMGAQSRGAEFDRATKAIDRQITEAQKAGDVTTAKQLLDTREDRAAKASNLAATVNTALGMIPMGMVLRPVKEIAPGAMGRVWAMADHFFKGAPVFATVGEAQKYLGEQMAKAYDPNAKYEFDWRAVVSGLIGGGFLSMAGPATQRRPPAKPADPHAVLPDIAEAVPPEQGRLPFGQGDTPMPANLKPDPVTPQEWARQQEIAQNWEFATPKERAEYAALEAKIEAARTPPPREQIGGGEAQLEIPFAAKPQEGQLGPGTPQPPAPMAERVVVTRQDWKRQQELAQNWEKLTPEERAEYGALEQKIAAAKEPLPDQRLTGTAQPELALEPPPTVTPPAGNLGTTINAPHPDSKHAAETTSRNPMPSGAGTAREAAPPSSLQPELPMPYPRVPDPVVPKQPNVIPSGPDSPHSVVTRGREAIGAGPQAAAGIHVLQPGQVDPTLQHATAYPAGQRTTFEKTRPPDPRPPSQEYTAATEKVREATRVFDEADRAARAGELTKEEYDRARATYEAAYKEYLAAHAQETGFGVEPLPRDRSLAIPESKSTQAVTETPVATDHTRMYQGERQPPNTFTTDRKIAEQYGAVRSIDVHNKQGMPFFTPSNEAGVFTTRNNIYRTRSRPVEELATHPVGEPVVAPEVKPPAPEVKPTTPEKPAAPEVKVAGPELEQKLKAQVSEPSTAKVKNDLINLFGYAYEFVKNLPDEHARKIWDIRQKQAEKNLPKTEVPYEQVKQDLIKAGYDKDTVNNMDEGLARAWWRLKNPPEPTTTPPTQPTQLELKLPAAETKSGGKQEVTYHVAPISGRERKARFTEKYTLREALSKFGVAKGLMEFTPKLRKMMEDIIGNMPVYFLPNSEFAKQGKNKYQGLYYWQQDLIFINERYKNDPAAMAATIFHEGIHGITTHALEIPEVRATVKTIMFDVRKSHKPEGPTKYGFKNEQEFVAEAFSNPAFERLLRDHILSPNVAKRLREQFNAQKPIKSAWDALVQTVRNVLKLPESQMSALEAVMRATEHAMIENPRAKSAYMAREGFQTQDYGTGKNKPNVEASRPVEGPPLRDEPRVSGAEPAGKGTVIARDNFGNEIKFTKETVHAAAARAKAAGYKHVFNEDGTPYEPPKTPTQTTTQTPATTTQTPATITQKPAKGTQNQATGTTAGGTTIPPKPPGPTVTPTPAPGTPPSPPGKIMEAVHAAADRLFDVGHTIQMLVSPMTRGTQTTMALAKDFANSLRRNQWEWTRLDQKIEREHTPERRKAMWEAADAESVAQQQGKQAGKAGLAGLSPAERATVEELHARGKDAWDRAVALGMVTGEGLPSYAPRLLINLAKSKGDGPTTLDPMGLNLRTTTPNLKRRKHLTTAETEAAAKAKFGPEAEVVKDIRTLPMVIAKLENAIAGRVLVNNIKEIGKRVGENTVVEGAKPNEPGWFTIDHPALKVWRKSGEEFVQVPLYIRGDFEGPLRATLTKPTNKLYRGAMDLKGKTMGLIMNSPMIHNAVEWGRALPTMPGKILTFKVYFEGNRAKNDPVQMREAIDNGLVPIGARFFNQDIHGIAEAPNLIPGRSWTAKVLGETVGRLPQKGMTAAEVKTGVLRSVDKAGNFWHNTLLWDRIGDLQMGLYTNYLTQLQAKGVDRQTASRAAAHLANRYAGALPPEAMSRGANMTANMLLFSRSFTLGNIGVMKDMLNGMPKDVRAQIARDVGSVDPNAAGYIKSIARRKAIGAVMMDIGMLYAANSILQSTINVLKGDKTLDEEAQGYVDRFSEQMKHIGEHPLELLTPMTIAGGVVGAAVGGVKGSLIGSLAGTALSQSKKLSSTQENEPGKEDRVKVGHTKDGTAIYMRLTPGKIGEEFEGYMNQPLDMLKRKLSTTARPAWQILSNDKGFGRKVFDPNAHTSEGQFKNILKVMEHIAAAQTPEGQVRAAADLVRGEGDSTVNALQTFGPISGTTFSRGAPGGEAQGELYKAREKHQYKLNDVLPEIRRLIRTEKEENFAKAQEMMNELGVPKALQKFYIRTAQDPSTRLTPRAMKDFRRYATPEEQRRMDRALELRGR